MNYESARSLARAIAVLAQPTIANQVREFAPRWFSKTSDGHISADDADTQLAALQEVLEQEIAAMTAAGLEAAISEHLSQGALEKTLLQVMPDVREVRQMLSDEGLRQKLRDLGLVRSMDITVTRPDRTAVTFDLSHVMFPAVLTASQAGPVMMVGPAGCGKTMIGQQVAQALGLKFYFNGAISSEHKVTGYKDAGGTYHTTPFREAFEHGGVYLFDEVDGSNPQAFLTLNAALANGMMDFPDKTVQMHPDFVCLAAANTYGRGADLKYVGRNALDAASLDRFTMLTLDYDEDLELQLSDNHAWTRQVQSWREAAQQLQVDHVISTRACVRGAQLLKLGMPQEVVAQSVVWKGLDLDDVAKIVAQSEADS